ncbi:flagellar filament capping protein FliD [Accumulibacter sp.]|uniref:flagellar filament capping protein FliD n=1 Tax=Accumulibacter sp. TaxID=2053492 RepID=UPI0025F226BF|nr:flagellar filament capping protein FliD [Accumulibacter sp.]MCM8596749.1 flagellar filament capping protein FliD [Accumulibacter sp.]MCM8624717.1 flagellar filament capping protein FliD [Accumulibacter sp.]MDS4050898.1 flagellar filament capping protein FliD [Accumulibacter sp.]
MAISSPGLGSNLDVNSIVSQLMALEKRPLTEIATREASYQAKLSALGSLQGAVSAVQTAAASLVPASGSTALERFSVFRTTVADNSAASASASATAVSGSYTLEVTQLAQAHRIVSATGSASPFSGVGNTLPGGGTLTISLDSLNGVSPNRTTSVSIASGATPENVRDAINGAAAGVSAVVINGVAGKQLVLTSDTAGSNQLITLSGIIGLAYDPNAAPQPATDPFSEAQAAQGASLRINGIDVHSETNSVTTAIEGVTLTLLKGPEAPAAALTTTLAISRDTSSLNSGVSALVKAFNDFQATASSLGSYDATSRKAAALTGDSTLRTVQNSLRAALGNVPSELSGAALQRLSDVGVSVQKDGRLSVDSTKLSAAISDNLPAVAALVAAYGRAIRSAADGLVGTSGLIAARTEGINASIRGLGSQSAALSTRLDAIEARYRRQFTSLDTLISGMTKTSNFLAQQLANLPGAKNS